MNDIGYDILKTDNGFTIIGSHGNISGSYAYFFTIDSEGNSTSEQLYGGYDQVLYSFEQTSDAGYIMVGSSGQAGNEQICLIKVNAEGAL